MNIDSKTKMDLQFFQGNSSCFLKLTHVAETNEAKLVLNTGLVNMTWHLSKDHMRQMAEWLLQFFDEPAL